MTTCPWDYAGAGIAEILDMADLFDKGHAPVAGGVLDQARIFIDAAQYIRGLSALCRAKLGIMNLSEI